MLNKIKSIFYFIIFIMFLSFIPIYYFSEENTKKINKNRNNLLNNSSEAIQNVPLLKDDTKDIINYPNTKLKKKKIKKRYFWDLLKK